MDAPNNECEERREVLSSPQAEPMASSSPPDVYDYQMQIEDIAHQYGPITILWTSNSSGFCYNVPLNDRQVAQITHCLSAILAGVWPATSWKEHLGNVFLRMEIDSDPHILPLNGPDRHTSDSGAMEHQHNVANDGSGSSDEFHNTQTPLPVTKIIVEGKIAMSGPEHYFYYNPPKVELD